MDRDQEITAEEDAEIAEAKIRVNMNAFQNAEDVALVFLLLGALGMMAAVFDVEFVQIELFRKLVEVGRGGIGNVVPAQRWDGVGHAGWEIRMQGAGSGRRET